MPPHPPRRLVHLSDAHDVDSFSCSKLPHLAEWLQRSGQRSMQQRSSVVWVDAEGPLIHGYFSLNASLLSRASGAAFPAILLPRLAKADGEPKGYGAELLGAAFLKAHSAAGHVGVAYLILDAANETLASWYATMGFKRVKERGTDRIRMRISIDDVAAAIGR